MVKLNFQHCYSSVQSVSHDPSEMLLIIIISEKTNKQTKKKTFLIIINVENSCAASCFCDNRDHFLHAYLNRNRKFKRAAFISNRNLS